MDTKQKISEVAIIILKDIDERLERIDNLDISEIKQEIIEVRSLINTSIPVLELLEKLQHENIKITGGVK